MGGVEAAAAGPVALATGGNLKVEGRRRWLGGLAPGERGLGRAAGAQGSALDQQDLELKKAWRQDRSAGARGFALMASPQAPLRLATTPGWLADLAGAWIFYSVLPLPPWPRPRFERIARFAPWIGALLGAIEALAWRLGQGHLPLLAQVALVLALAIWLSGGLHLDGAMDTADGLAAGDRCLEAMRDSRVGASGVQALVLLLLLRAAALVTLAAAAPWALVWASVWGRIAPLVAMGAFPYLRDNPGQGGSAGFHRRHWAGFGQELLPALLLLGLLGPWSALAGLPWQGWLGLVPAVLVPWGLGRRLGGHSGDTYGACVEWTGSWTLLLIALALAVPGS